MLKEQEKEMDVSRSWEEAQNNFKETLDKIKQLKADIEKGIQLNHSYQDAIATSKQLQAKKAHHQQLLEQIDAETAQNKTHLEETENELQENKMEQELLNHTLSQEKSNKSALDKLVGFFKGDTNQDSKNPDLSERVTKLIDDRDSLKQKQKTFKQQAIELEKQKQNSTSNIAQIKKQEQAQEDAIQQYETFKAQHSSVQFSDDAFWAKENYKVRQEKVLNTSDELQFYRGLLFIQAMVLHKLVLLGNVKSVQAGLWDFERRYEYIKDKPEKVQNAWNVLHLVYPVISTTFASFRNMYRDMPKDFIDYLYIDEAGQAVPQAAVGAMQRARQVVAVGDPIQIEPVVTLDNHLIDLVRKAYQVPERLVSAEASVQSIADNANVFGYWKGTDSGNPTWIGIPLWVHRRCLNPMFDISNIIAYEEKMVLPDYIKKKPGQASWLDIKGKAGPKQFVKEQGEAVVNCLLKDWKKALQNGESAPSTYVISPFTKVKDEIRKSVRNALQIEINLDRKAASEWAKKSIGTVHTFQGKEADKVYFVTGTDDTQNGAIKWSCQKPNLINVAVTRAKKEFVIIGDKERISKLENYEIIAEHVN
ncbi:AAA domain-containing protein [Staphylococcus sp. IVB6181]|uniref:DEAD/DEAH box helicase n=1 Tax=Staphylococcus sp. IVB6181 TaxID=2929481 RepID=UPI0021D379B0|nr:AAA domain-containing protein [Staphylococcus sp. IVB6181]UXV35099.1 AAA domain-containing protein [Staphylococcus sp. IVB6181]